MRTVQTVEIPVTQPNGAEAVYTATILYNDETVPVIGWDCVLEDPNGKQVWTAMNWYTRDEVLDAARTMALLKAGAV